MTQHRTERRAVREWTIGACGGCEWVGEVGDDDPDCYCDREEWDTAGAPEVRPVRVLEGAALLTALREHLNELRERGLTADGEAQADREESDYFYGIRDALGEAVSLLRSRLTDLGLDPLQDPEEGT